MRSFETVLQSKYLGALVINQHFIQKEIMTLNSGIAICHSKQNLLPSCLLSRNLKNGTHKTIILPLNLWVWNLVSDIKGETYTEGV
jgi:hypothetical protein